MAGCQRDESDRSADRQLSECGGLPHAQDDGAAMAGGGGRTRRAGSARTGAVQPDAATLALPALRPHYRVV